MDASHGDSSLFGPHLNPPLPIRFLLSVNYACFSLLRFDFQKLLQLKLRQQSRAPLLTYIVLYFISCFIAVDLEVGCSIENSRNLGDPLNFPVIKARH